MTLETVIRQSAITVIFISLGAIYSALLVRWSIRLTARMLGTATPQFSTARTLAVSLALALVSYGIWLTVQTAVGNPLFSGLTFGRMTVPWSWIVVRPIEFFLLAGLMIHYLPTTVARSCLVSTIYQLLHIAVMAVMITLAALGS